MCSFFLILERSHAFSFISFLKEKGNQSGTLWRKGGNDEWKGRISRGFTLFCRDNPFSLLLGKFLTWWRNFFRMKATGKLSE